MKELNNEEQIKGLMLLVFDKAKTKSKKNNAYGLSKFLELKVGIDQRTLTRYYNGYILNRENEKRTPYDYNLDSLSQYLGFNDFEAYCSNLDRLKDKIILIEKNNELEKKLNRIKKIAFLCCLILFVVATLFILKYYKKNCMIWVEDHYEKIRCSGLDTEKPLDYETFENMKKITICQDSILTPKGRSITHYFKLNNKVEFFTYHGNHPVYEERTLKEITPRIIEKYIKSCDSID